MSRKPPFFSNSSFLLLAHYATFAYQDLLFEYLIENKAKRVTKINLPLPELPFLKQIDIAHCEYGRDIKVKKIKTIYNPPVLAYVFQSIQLVWLVTTSLKTYDIVIAENSLLAFLCLILRFLGKCRVVIFYSHGIDKNRFKNKYLNTLYQSLDNISSTNSDFNWFLNKNFYEKRKNQGIPRQRLFWIPASVPIKSIKRKENVFNNKIVFLGVVNKKNGAHIFVDIVKAVKKKIPNIQLDIIGNGDFQETLKKEIIQNKLGQNIKLLGLKEFKDFAKILTEYTVGIAPYEDKFDTLTASSDSMKMRVYFAAGLPVVITKGFIFSDEVEKNNLGFTPVFKADKMADAISQILTNKELCLSLRKKALRYSKETDVHTIYDKTFSAIL